MQCSARGATTHYDRAVLVAFFALTFALAWSAWSVASAFPENWSLSSALKTPIFLLGVFAPAICALGLTARSEGRRGVERLFAQIGKWRVRVGWYLFAAGYIAALKLTVAVMHRAMTGGWPRFGETPWPLVLIALFFSTPVQAGEELGWRAYALPRLASRLGLGPASLLLGLIWAAWHLPLFFSPETDTYGQSFPLYLLQVTALSVAMAWLYWRTGRSLLLVMLMHAAVNNTKDIVPSAVPGASNPFGLSTSLVAWLTVGLLWIAAVYFFVDMRGTSKRGDRGNG